ncbi:STN domain-containing protein [Bythopirellula polymerisocia]|uniref:STN domain-containing protein n=1 Tax=Bythopirellula polymerisocia TaxID=2528003 RepID=UPI0011B5DB54|nr:STN domain-containing protein [Bythopirellula polymerisocia]
MRKFACNFCRFLLRGWRVGFLVVLISLDHSRIEGAEHLAPPTGQWYFRLNAPVSAVWKGQSLGVVLERLAASQGIPFWVDRRVDIQRTVDLQFNDVPLTEVLDRLTKLNSLGWSPLGNICYVGPRDAAREIATLLELAKQSVEGLSTAKRVLWMRTSPISWPRLSQPRSLLTEWLNDQGITLHLSELIEHDLWAAKKLPPLPLVERVVLLLAGFDLTCQISPTGDKCTVVQIPRPVNITLTYEAGQKSRAAIAQLSRESPQFHIERQGEGLTATGRWEDHVRFSELLAGKSSRGQNRQAGRARQVFSLKLENEPFGKVITAIARQVQLEVVWEEGLLDSPADPRQRLISCEVVDADLSTLLQELITQVGVGYRIESGKLLLSTGDE